MIHLKLQTSSLVLVTIEPLLLERGISLELPVPPPAGTKSDKLKAAYQAAMDRVTEKAANTQFTGLSAIRQKRQRILDANR